MSHPGAAHRPEGRGFGQQPLEAIACFNGYLERAPSPEIRQRIIDGRIRHLESEINTFQDQIDKLLGGG